MNTLGGNTKAVAAYLAEKATKKRIAAQSEAAKEGEQRRRLAYFDRSEELADRHADVREVLTLLDVERCSERS